MRVRVDPAWHHVASGGVKGLVPAEALADLRNLAVLDQHVGLVGAVCGDDGAVFNYRAHGGSPFSQSSTIPAVSTTA